MRGGGGGGGGGGANVMMGNGAPNDWLGHLRDAFIRRKVHHRQLDWVLGKDKGKGQHCCQFEYTSKHRNKHINSIPIILAIKTIVVVF